MWKTLVGALAVFTTLSGPVVAQQASVKVIGGVAAFNEALLPIYTAQEEGYFKEAGVDLELVNFKGGGPTVQALVGGSINVCFCAADHVVRLRSRRQPAVILVGLDAFHSYGLVAKATSSATDLKSLRGKSIGITSPGSLTDNTLRYSIREAGLSPERDFQIVGAGTGAAMQAAIDSGQVEAGLAIVTDIANMMQKQDAYKVILDYRQIPYPSFAALALESWVQKNSDVARRMSQAIVRAINDLKGDPELARSIIAKMYPDFSPTLAAEIAKSAVERTPDGGVVSAESISTLNKILTSADDSLKPVTLEEVFNPSLLTNK